MARILNGVDIGIELCSILGLKVDHVKSVVIKVEADDVVLIEIVQYMYNEELSRLKEILKRYHLEEDEKGELKTETENGTDKNK